MIGMPDVVSSRIPPLPTECGGVFIGGVFIAVFIRSRPLPTGMRFCSPPSTPSITPRTPLRLKADALSVVCPIGDAERPEKPGLGQASPPSIRHGRSTTGVTVLRSPTVPAPKDDS